MNDYWISTIGWPLSPGLTMLVFLLVGWGILSYLFTFLPGQKEARHR